MNVYGTGIAQIVEAPHLIQQGVAGKDAVVVGSQEVEQLQLLGRNINGSSLELQLILQLADLDVIETDHLVVALASLRLIAAKHSLHAGGKLLHIEGRKAPSYRRA